MSTVTISIKDIFGAGQVCDVVFEPQNTPFIQGTSLIPTATKKVTTNDTGAASTTLEPGTYLVSFSGIAQNTDQFVIGVPNDNSTYTLTSLINAGTTVPNPPAAFLQVANNLSDVEDAATALSNLGGVNSGQAASAAPVQSVAGRTGDVALTKTDVGLQNVANVDTTNASNISSGTLSAARGGAGTVSGLLKANGSGAVSAATAGTDYVTPTGDGSGLTNLNANNLTSGTVSISRLPVTALRSGSVKFASQLGCALNTNLDSGGGTDDTSILQSALDVMRTGGGGKLVIDGPALVSTLKPGSNTTIEFLPGAGLFQIAGTSRAVIHNYNQSGSTRTDSNIAIIGPGIINQNRSAQTNAIVDWVVGVDLNGVAGYAAMRDFTIRNSVKFATRFTNCENIISSGITATQDSLQIECDGVHVNGPFEHCLVENATVVNVNDDGIGINTDETYEDGNSYAYVSYGGGKTVVVRNITLVNTNQGVRILNQVARLESVTVDGVYGSIGSYAVNAQITFGKGAGNIGSIILNNIDVRIRDAGNLYDNSNSEPVPYWNTVCVDLKADQVHLGKINGQFSDGRPIVYLGTGADIKVLSVDQALTNSSSTLVENHGSVETLLLSNFSTKGTAVDTSSGSISNFARSAGASGTLLAGTISNSGELITLSESPTLLSNWQFEESTASTTIADSTGSGNTLAATNFVSTTGKINNGADMDGSSSYFESTLDLSGDRDFTIAGWFNVSDYSSPRVIFAQQGDTGIQGQAYQVFINSDGTIHCQIHHAATTDDNTSSAVLSSGTWQFVCLRHDHSVKTMYLTIDGTTDTFTYTDTVDNCTQHLRVGCNGDSSGGSPAYFFLGQLDEFSVWNYKIDDTTMASVYNSGSGKQPPF